MLAQSVESESIEEIKTLAQQGRGVECVGVIYDLYSSGELFRDPILSAQLPRAARKSEVWKTVFNNLKEAESVEDADAVSRNLRMAFLLRMNEMPQAKAVLYPLAEKYGVASYVPTLDELTQKTLDTLGLTQEYKKGVETKIKYYFENGLFDDSANNRIRHTALSSEQLNEILVDTLGNWVDTTLRPHEVKNKVSHKIAKQLARDFIPDKDISGNEKDRVANILVNLFQNEDIRARYPKVAEYLDGAAKRGFNPNREVNGQMLAFLYSIKLFLDESRLGTPSRQPNENLYPDPMFGKEVRYITPPSNNRFSRRMFLSKSAIGAAVVAGTYPLWGSGIGIINEAIADPVKPQKLNQDKLFNSPSSKNGTRTPVSSPSTIPPRLTEQPLIQEGPIQPAEPEPRPPTFEELTEEAREKVGADNIAEFFLGELVNIMIERRRERFRNPAVRERLKREDIDKRRLVFLCQGIDQTRKRPNSMNDTGTGRSDVTMVVSVDLETFSLTGFSLPRDLACPQLNGYKYNEGGNKINNMTMGPSNAEVDVFELSQDIVEAATGVPIDAITRFNIDFLEGFDEEGFFPGLFDSLFPEGLPIYVDSHVKDDAFPDENYGIKTVEFIPGHQVMGGRDLTEYARTRHADTDFGRIERQKKVVTVLFKALGLQVFEDFKDGDTDTLDKIIQTLESHYEHSNLFSTLNLVEVVNNIRDSLVELRSSPKGMATLTVLLTNSLERVGQIFMNPSYSMRTMGLDRTNILGNATVREANGGENALKPVGSNLLNPDAGQYRNFLPYYSRIRSEAQKLFG